MYEIGLKIGPTLFNMENNKIEIGSLYGHQEVLSFSRRDASNSYYMCKCDICGNIYERRSDHVRNLDRCRSCSDKNKIVDLSGKKFGRLLVLSVNKTVNRQTYYNCLCDCGKLVSMRNCHLTSGNTKSCGCLNDELRAERNYTHGKSRTPECHVWNHIKTRCENLNIKGAKYYSAKGITMCDRWRYSFENFLSDMGERPGPKYSIDRIDSNGNYEPSNCRWATAIEQANNMSSNHIVEFDGASYTIANLARKFDVNYSVFYRRLRDGWPIEKALKTPLMRTNKKNKL